MHGIVIHVYTLVQNIEKKTLAHYVVISCPFPPHVPIFYIVCSPIFIWKNVATGSMSSVSVPLQDASWSTDKIKLRGFVYFVSDVHNT